MTTIYQNILSSIENDEKLLAILIDPDKIEIENIHSFILKVNQSIANFIFVGGSAVHANDCDTVVFEIRKHTNLPIVLFPGDVTQITGKADALLFLSLISGRNPQYLIGKHVQSISRINETTLEIIPTGYILIENGKETSVQRVTKTQPLPRKEIQTIVNTAKAGELLGMKLMYLEAGSGAAEPINTEIIKNVNDALNIPLIIGGGIRSKKQLHNAYDSGADLVVIGTAFEEDESFFDEIKI